MKIIILLFLSLIAPVTSCTLLKELPYPYKMLEQLLPFDGTGQFGYRQKAGLSYVIQTYKPKIVVEIGSYLGASTRYIAQLLPEDGVVYAVDHWLGNASWVNWPNYDEKQKLFYSQFLSNIIHTGLCQKIRPMKMTSRQAANTIDVVPDLVFIDGAHDYQSVYDDLTHWYALTKDQGVLCGDDYNGGTTSKPVKKAVDAFAAKHGLKVRLIENWFWYYESSTDNSLES